MLVSAVENRKARRVKPARAMNNTVDAILPPSPNITELEGKMASSDRVVARPSFTSRTLENQALKFPVVTF